uniref:Phospholipid phosphatase 2 n=1 Tax=Sphenodon punctatus TaxID=8508 RepID=A0A8D0GJU7_SPHPU
MDRKKVFVLLDVLCLVVASLPFVILTLLESFTHGLIAGVTITCTIIISAGKTCLVYTEHLYSCSEYNNDLAALYKVVGTFLFGRAVSQSLTDLANMTGWLRPNFQAVYQPNWALVNCSAYVQLEKVCQGDLRNHTMHYAQARLAGKWARLLRPTIQFFLIICGVYVGVYVGYTQVSDYKHHWCDVLVGLLQGVLITILIVHYVSDFFKQRPSLQCKEKDPECKPSLPLTLSKPNRNCYGYRGVVSMELDHVMIEGCQSVGTYNH